MNRSDSPNRMLKRNLDSVESWIDSYFESLAKFNTETGQSEALGLKRSNFPKALYRYRSLDRLAYTLEELRDGYPGPISRLALGVAIREAVLKTGEADYLLFATGMGSLETVPFA